MQLDETKAVTTVAGDGTTTDERRHADGHGGEEAAGDSHIPPVALISHISAEAPRPKLLTGERPHGAEGHGGGDALKRRSLPAVVVGPRGQRSKRPPTLTTGPPRSSPPAVVVGPRGLAYDPDSGWAFAASSSGNDGLHSARAPDCEDWRPVAGTAELLGAGARGVACEAGGRVGGSGGGGAAGSAARAGGSVASVRVWVADVARHCVHELELGARRYECAAKL